MDTHGYRYARAPSCEALAVEAPHGVRRSGRGNTACMASPPPPPAWRSFLMVCTTQTNAQARHGKLDPVIGRDEEIRRAVCDLTQCRLGLALACPPLAFALPFARWP